MFDTLLSGLHHREVLQRLAKLFVVLPLTLSLGAHWMFLQSVAWFGMVVNYSQHDPLLEAISKTFDGRHPCRLCKFVQAGKAQEKKQDAPKPKTKLDQGLVYVSSVMLFPPSLERCVLAHSRSSNSRCESPPTPPPEQA